ncbi:hypothetical protein [Govanella unica]|uniref:Bacterial Ig domain-containing protein n=1 Tax=Govanella unica TaxID=2975056 RepID=A0A9X3Z6I9_9PROT|nr:hypothetical protein [Govania unica]MDA5193260.1 hypothetical protein [Govania unica]
MTSNDPKQSRRNGKLSGGGWKRLLMIGFAVLVVLALWAVLAPERRAVPGAGARSDADIAAEAVLPDGQSQPPSFDVVRVSREGTGVIAGRASPGAKVTILADDKALSEVQADRRGDWALIFDNPLPSGGTRLSLSARRANAAPVVSEDEVILSVPAPAVAKPGMKTPARETFVDPVDEGVMALRVKRSASEDGSLFASEVLQRPSASADYLSDVTLDVADYDGTGATVLNGRGKPRWDVRLYIDNVFAAEVQVGDDGRWIYPMPKPFDDKDHRVRVDQVTDRGVVEARVELGLRLVHVPLTAAGKAGYVISETVGDDGRMWRIAYLRDDDSTANVLVIGSDRKQIRDVKTIYPGQNMDLPASGQGRRGDSGS